MKSETTADLVLVGGGHTHVQVIRRFMMRPLPGVRLTVVLDRPEALYSGMVPGRVAGDYETHELEIDVVPLARRARARVVLSAATRIDPVERRISLRGRPDLRYDVASLDVGSTVRGLELPGVAAHALATRPIRRFVDELDVRLAAASAGNSGALRVVVVGAGAAGMELAFTLDARLHAARTKAEILVLADGDDVLPGSTGRMRARARRAAELRGIAVRGGARVTGVQADAVTLDSGERVASDLTLLATGAAALPVITGSPLPQDESGFVRVRSTLQVVGHDDLFAVGDCSRMDEFPWVPRAGVYAVRQGPVLDVNLRAHLTGGALRRYRPQRDFLSLLNLGQGSALGARFGLAFQGPLVWRLKDWIDRRFMGRFQVLTEGGAPAEAFPSPEDMGMEEMPCGGCAAKVGATSLERALTRLEPAPADDSVLLGLDRPDDAAALRTRGGDVLLATVDGFRAFSDDPYLVGRVAAVNAASDVHAKGGRPRHALALVNVPEEDPERAEETLYQVLSGLRAALDELGVSLVGGHTTAGDELFVGLSISGDLPPGATPLPLDGARVEDRLVLTKPLGTGVVLAADMQGRARGAWVQAAHASMLRANRAAAEIARRVGATACTDVSGFGLAGHLGALTRASGVSARIRAEALPALPGAVALLASGVRSTFHDQNASLRPGVSIRGDWTPAAELVFDPQTSGGLLFSLPASRETEAMAALAEAGEHAAAIGEVRPLGSDGAPLEVACQAARCPT